MTFFVKNPTGWKTISNAFVKRPDDIIEGGVWSQLVKGFVKTTTGWKTFFSETLPVPKSADPPLFYVVDPSGFADPSIGAYNTYKMYLTRGKWINNPRTFEMKIQRSTSSTFNTITNLISETKTYTSYNDADFESQIPLTTANRPTFTNALTRDGNSYRGFIKATNASGLFYEYITPVVKPRIDAQVNIIRNLNQTVGTNPTANGGTFSWLYDGYETIVAADVFSQTISFYAASDPLATTVYSQAISPGTSTSAAPTSTVVISNAALQANTEYVVTLSVVMNDLWKNESLQQTTASDTGNFTTAANKPATPIITSATDVGTNRPFNNGAVSLVWTQPTGGATATGYKIEYSTGDHIAYVVLNSNTGNTNTSGTFTGLTAGVSYKFYVTALSSGQNSDRSGESSSVLITTVPDVPRLVGASAGNAQALVFWELPTSDGGKSILDYRATSTPGGLTSTVNALETTVTGLTNYTPYTFTVSARNLNGRSEESSASNSVTPQLPLPVGSGTVTINYDSESSYVYKITGYGTWSNSATKYDYEWQTSPNNSTWTTRSSGTDVSTIPNYNAAAYKGNFIRLRVYGRNQTGPATTPLVSATTTIFYTTPVINSFTVTGGNSSVSYAYSYSSDDPTVSIEIGYKLSSATTYTTISSPASSGTINLTSGTYDFRLFVTNSASGAFRTAADYVTAVTVVSPTISGISIYNGTLFPSAASSISVSNTAPSNTGSVTWLNNSNTSLANLRSVTGSGTLAQQADPSTLTSSGTFAVNSTGTATATIRAINTSKRVEVTWAQTNAQSYRILYTVSGVPGTQEKTGNDSNSNPVVLLGSSANTFTITSITVYPQTSQGGTGVTLSAPAGTSAAGADRVTDTVGDGTVTYTPLPGLTPIISAATSTATGFTGQVTNYSASYTWNITTSSGSVSWGTPNANEATYNFTVTGLAPGSSATVTITTTRPGYSDGSATRTGTALTGAALIPTFGTNTPISGGFTGSVNNYNSSWTTWNIATNSGSVSWGTPSDSTYPFTVTGLGLGASATVTVTTGRTGYSNGSGQTTGTAIRAGLTPTFGNNTRGSNQFTGSVTNYDTNYSWFPSVSAGTFTWGTQSVATRPFTVTGLNDGQSSTVTMQTSRLGGYEDGSAQTTGTSLLAGLVPIFETNVSTSTGFTGAVTNYSDTFGWGFSVTPITATFNWGTASGSRRPFTVTGLAPGASATVELITTGSIYKNGFGQTTGSALALTKLSTPDNVLASDNRTDGINVTWTAVSGAAYYGVWYGPPTPTYNDLADFGGNRNTSLITGTSYLDTSMGSGVTRDYYVQAYRSGDPAATKSDWGGPDSGTRLAVVSAPVNTVAPSVTPSSGAAGTTFSSTTGTWTNSPTSYSYLWQYLEGSNYITTGQTTSTFSSTTWAGYTIRCRVTATNAGGSTQAFSNSATVTSAGSTTGATQITYVAPTTNAVNVTTGSGGTIPDDGWFTLNLPFTTWFNGTAYSQIHIGTNSYATFGGGSGNFSGLSASNPAFNKIMVGAGDCGSTGIYFTSSASSWTMRYVGSASTTGSPINQQWELQCSSSSPKTIRLSIVQVSESGGITGMYSSSSLINSLGGAGTSWNITSA